ncbi:MAG: methionyl-tRNA formyltransferase [Propionibacteriaceae bacterium]|jgi:methionyl-tRNA formyltransferase|nr:methionyl-tRNA formyltransferase [Propionibacteriaceae bacterium]
MRLLFAGTPDVATPVLEKVAGVHEVVAVLTRPPAARGRSGRLVASPVGQRAAELGIRVSTPTHLRDPQFVATVREAEVDCCVVVAYGGLITTELLDIPRWGWINLHFSLLPAYRGAAPVQRALLDGCTRTGVTTFQIVKALDAGPTYLRRPVEIGGSETAGDLLTRLSLVGADAMVETLDLARSGFLPQPQSTQGISLAPKVTTAQARLDVTRPASDVVNRVRAMSPEPGAWAELAGTRFKVVRAHVVDPDAGAKSGVRPETDPGAATGMDRPGELVASKRHLLCRVSDGWIALDEVQAAGKKPMAGADWARGAWHEGMTLE